MIVYLDGKEAEVPDCPPTPRVIKLGDQIFALTTDNRYISVSWFNEKTKTLRSQSGKVCFECK